MDDTDAAIDAAARSSRRSASGSRSTTSGPATRRSTTCARFPIDIVKIDKAFIDGVASDKEARGLIKAILSMADTLDLQTVAEGVESRDQVNRLEQLGSALVQGFYYARPLTPEAAEALMTTGTSGSDDPTAARGTSVGHQRLNAVRDVYALLVSTEWGRRRFLSTALAGVGRVRRGGL